ncbi:MAG: hypothetical protein NVV73_12325 [Cellvibrionaceae bacterium]|nr:hypothetical protein [Cellvibrionaceae bacterium]
MESTPATFDSAVAGLKPTRHRQPQRQPAGIRQAGLELSGQRGVGAPHPDGQIMLSRHADMLAAPIAARSGVPQGNPGRHLGAWKPITARAWAASRCSGRWRPWAMTARAHSSARPSWAALRIYPGPPLCRQRDDLELGGRLRPDPVHAQHLPEIRGGRRRRQPDQPVALARRRAGLRSQPAGETGLAAGPDLGL